MVRDCPATVVCSKPVLRDCPTTMVSSKPILRDCPTAVVCSKPVPRDCPTIMVCSKPMRRDCPTIVVFSKPVLRDCTIVIVHTNGVNILHLHQLYHRYLSQNSHPAGIAEEAIAGVYIQFLFAVLIQTMPLLVHVLHGTPLKTGYLNTKLHTVCVAA